MVLGFTQSGSRAEIEVAQGCIQSGSREGSVTDQRLSLGAWSEVNAVDSPS